MIFIFLKYLKYKLGLKLNFTIPENVAKGDTIASLWNRCDKCKYKNR